MNINDLFNNLKGPQENKEKIYNQSFSYYPKEATTDIQSSGNKSPNMQDLLSLLMTKSPIESIMGNLSKNNNFSGLLRNPEIMKAFMNKSSNKKEKKPSNFEDFIKVKDYHN